MQQQQQQRQKGIFCSLTSRDTRRRKVKDATEEACTEEEMLRAINGYMFVDYNTTQKQRSTDETVIISGRKRNDWWKDYNRTEHATVYGQVSFYLFHHCIALHPFTSLSLTATL